MSKKGLPKKIYVRRDESSDNKERPLYFAERHIEEIDPFASGCIVGIYKLKKKKRFHVESKLV